MLLNSLCKLSKSYLSKISKRLKRKTSVLGQEPLQHQGTDYFDEIDIRYSSKLAKYTTTETDQTLETTFSNVNSQFFAAYGPEYENKLAENVSIDPPWYYQDLLERIKALPNVSFKTCLEALKHTPTNNEIICTIRHDVDGDIVAAQQQAEMEKKTRHKN